MRTAFRIAILSPTLLALMSLGIAATAARGDLVFFKNPDVGDFVPNTATPEFLAAIGGAPDEFISFAVDKNGVPLPGGPSTTPVLGTIFSDQVVLSTKASAFGPDSPFVLRFVDIFFFPNTDTVGPTPGFNGILSIDFLAAGRTASAVGFGPVDDFGLLTIRIYSDQGALLATELLPADRVFTFFGAVATGPEQIGRVELDGDFFAIQDLQFKLTAPIPEPATWMLLTLGSTVLLCWQLARRRSRIAPALAAITSPGSQLPRRA